MVYPNTLDSFGNPSGTQFLEFPDHGAEHRTVGSAIVGIETTLGLNGGTNILKDFTAGQFPVRTNVGGTIVQTLIGGTINNTNIGTSQITGGTVGTASVIGGTVANAFVGTPQITGGTIGTAVVTGGTVNATQIRGFNVSTATPTNNQLLAYSTANTQYQPTTFSAVTMAMNGTSGSSTTTSATAADVTNASVQVALTVIGTVAISVTGAWYNGANNLNNFFRIVRDSTQVGAEVQYDLASAGLVNERKAIALTAVDAAVAVGTYSYKLQHRTTGGTLTTENVRISVIAAT